ncbi:hypothetical protein I4U23_010934 [Adineta vaga]|nr:hypothetical protein I4U23_010934 [Adineta vaga]
MEMPFYQDWYPSLVNTDQTIEQANLIDQLSYQQLQEFQWKYYHHIGITQNIWYSRVSKGFAENYSVCYTYGRSKPVIEQRLKEIEKHLKETQSAIEQFEQVILFTCEQNDDCLCAMKELYSIIYQLQQMNIEEDIALLQQRLTSVSLQSSSNLLHEIINDMDINIQN